MDAVWQEGGMIEPTFDVDGTPTEETLEAIEKWEPNFSMGDPWADLFNFVRSAWNLDYGAIRNQPDENGEMMICFITGGWSDNETIQGAMSNNFMLNAMRWESSHRGGLTKYKMVQAK